MPTPLAERFALMLSPPLGAPEEICAFLGDQQNLFTSTVSDLDGTTSPTFVVGPPDMNVVCVTLYPLTRQGVIPVGAGPITTYRLHTTRYDDIADIHALPGLTLPTNGATTVMVTTALSGCVLVYQPSGGESREVKIIHLQPPQGPHPPPMSGAALQRELERARPRFLDQTRPTRIYGRLNLHVGLDQGVNSNLIALCREGKWTLYAQEFNPVSRTVYGAYAFPMYVD